MRTSDYKSEKRFIMLWTFIIIHERVQRKQPSIEKRRYCDTLLYVHRRPAENEHRRIPSTCYCGAYDVMIYNTSIVGRYLETDLLYTSRGPEKMIYLPSRYCRGELSLIHLERHLYRAGELINNNTRARASSCI